MCVFTRPVQFRNSIFTRPPTLNNRGSFHQLKVTHPGFFHMIDGSEPNTCKKDKTGSFYYLSVLVKDAAAQMVAGGCRDCSNVEFIENGKDIDMKAVCQIQGGKKLFNCYGRDYWSQKTDVRNPQCPVCKKCLINNEWKNDGKVIKKGEKNQKMMIEK